MLNKFLLYFSIITQSSAFSQNYFQKTFGGYARDVAYSIINTLDRGYLTVGQTNSFGQGNNDIYILKFNNKDSIQWVRTLGGPGNEYANSVLQTMNGDYVLAGYSNSFSNGSGDIYIVRLDSNGNLIWGRTVGELTGPEVGFSVIQTKNGSFLIAGHSNPYASDNGGLYLVKMDSIGELIWTKILGGAGYDGGTSLTATIDGGSIVCGITDSFGMGGYDIYVVKLDSNSTPQWSRTVGGTANDWSHSIIQCYDGGYALAGFTNSFGAGGHDFYIVKLDNNGNLLWTRTIGGSGEDYGEEIIQTNDGGLVVVGQERSFGSGFIDTYIIKLDINSNLLWTKSIGEWHIETGYSLIQTSDSNYIIAGETFSSGAGNYDVLIAKLDANGNTCISTITGGNLGSGGVLGIPTSSINLGGVIDSGGVIGTGGESAIICLTGLLIQGNEKPIDFKLYQNYPNPFNPSTKIRFDIPASVKSKMANVKLIVYDVVGREVALRVNQQLKPGSYEVEWNGTNYPSGLYFYQLTADNFRESKKMILVK